MKWVLVVYFMTTAGWQSAETLGKDKIKIIKKKKFFIELVAEIMISN